MQIEPKQNSPAQKNKDREAAPLKRRFQGQSGLVKTIVIVVVILLVISYFGLNLRDVVNQPNTQDNFSYVWGWLLKGWEVIKGPVLWVWNEVIVKYIVMQGVKPSVPQ